LKNLILFDIDGTLLQCGTISRECLSDAFSKVTGHSLPETVSFAGKTDPLIVREAFRSIALPKRDWVEKEQLVLRKYPRYLERRKDDLAASTQLLRGVRELLSYLTERDFPLALLTGNLENTARFKLDVFELNRYFPVGGFGSDCADRNRLARIALERASRHFGFRFEPKRCWVVGDTPRDLEAARLLGARSLGVATGSFAEPVLEEFFPSATAPDLGSLGDIVKLLSSVP
jgi:phosphoglycolate phosphatase-like HAD superfamily hydrolase